MSEISATSKATIVTWRWRKLVEKGIPAGNRVGHVDVFREADQFDYLSPDDLEKTLTEVELVPTGKPVKDVLK